MSLAIIDAREWQKIFDLKTGQSVNPDNRLIRLVRKVQAGHPYPGDLERAGNSWVTDTALDLIEGHDPSLAFLSYARQFFVGRYSMVSEHEWRNMVEEVFAEVERFTARSGFTPIIVGTGGMIPFGDFIDVTRLDGLVLSTHWSARYAGLYGGTSRDLEQLSSMSGIERIVLREEFRNLFPECPVDAARLPEYLLVAKPGNMFRTVGGAFRRVRGLPAPSFHIPVATRLGTASQITEIRNLINDNIHNCRIALIVVEGLGMEDFPWPCRPCSNGRDWFFYEAGDAQYITLSTGRHQVFGYPAGYRFFQEDGEEKEFPFSGYFTSVPEDTLGAGLEDVRSIAVGNRSMIMHMASGADVSVECFARNLFNQGTMAVIHRPDK